MRILFLSAWYPHPPSNGSKIRVFNLLRALSKLHEITLITLAEEHEMGPTPPELNKLCSKVIPVPSPLYRPNSLRALMGFLSEKPRVLVDRHSDGVVQAIRSKLGTGNIDLIVASQWYMAAYADHFQDIPAIFEEMELGMFANKIQSAVNPLKRFRNRLTWMKMNAYFSRLLSRFIACTVVSQEEMSLLQQMVPAYRPVSVVPNFIHLQDYHLSDVMLQPDTLIFTGSFRYRPNWEAMQWFLDGVFPRVRAQLPNVRLIITGDSGGYSLSEDQQIITTGFVKDLRPLVASSWVSLAPMQSGGGTRLKILESMALGTPVVSTSKGAEGLDALSGEHLLIADDPIEFAEAVLRLFKDPLLRKQVSEKGYRLVQNQYSMEAIGPRFLDLIDSVCGGTEERIDSQQTVHALKELPVRIPFNPYTARSVQAGRPPRLKD